MWEKVKAKWAAVYAWAFQHRHKRQAQKLVIKSQRAFTEHPKEAGESYLQHLWFTARMSTRLVIVGFLLLIHGIFPFLFTRTASERIEEFYRIMKNRTPVVRPGAETGAGI